MSRIHATVVAAFVVAMLALPTAAHAAPPTNDQFANATHLVGPASSVLGDTSEAGIESNERCDVGCGPSVWFHWKTAAAVPTDVTFNLCASSFDTVLSVWTGSEVGTLSLAAYNDDSLECQERSVVAFRAQPGVTYSIRVSSYDASGAYVLSYPDGAQIDAQPGPEPVDQTPPVLDAPSVVGAFATSAAGAPVAWTATATDDVDGAVPVTCTPESGSTFAVGTTSVTCSASDAAGNDASATFPVYVTYAWGGFEGKLGDDAPRYRRGKEIPVKFRLAAPSAGVAQLSPRVYLAPVAADGSVGAEVPRAATFERRRNGTWVADVGTKGLALGGWQLRLDLGDGDHRVTRFTLR